MTQHEMDRKTIQSKAMQLDTMKTSKVIWFLVKKHKFFLVLLAFLLENTYLLTQIGY